VAKFLQDHPRVAWVNYPGLPGDKYHALAQKYLPKGASGLLNFLRTVAGAVATSIVSTVWANNATRNPSAVGEIRGALILGLVLIESLVIYVLLISLILFFLKPFGG